MNSSVAGRLASFALLMVAVGCASGATEEVTGHSPPTTGVELLRDRASLDPDEREALEALGSTTPGSPIADSVGGEHGGHGEPPDRASTAERPPELDAELDAARVAAESLMTKTRLSEAGYVVGSYWSQGVGSHYIAWHLVGAPFDPARPAMLLVDTTPGGTRRLAGLSYWVRSDGPPRGFTGEVDAWHNHRGLCFIEGVLTRLGVADPAACEGVWIDGADLWMLHAWVVPGYENEDGVFWPTNPKLCPPRTGIDAAFC